MNGLPLVEAGGEKHSMSKGLWIALGVVGVLVLVVLMVFGSYIGARNQMVAKDQAVKSKWSEVDVQMERRADLIPNLVETVKGFTKEESTVFGDIANARAGMLNAQGPQAKIAANGQLDSAIGRLLLLTENYPHTALQRSVHAPAGRACRAPRTASAWRASAITTRLQDYNTFVLQFPNNIWAGMAGFQVNNAFFTASPTARTVPAVKF